MSRSSNTAQSTRIARLIRCLEEADRAAHRLAGEVSGEAYAYADAIVDRLRQLRQQSRALEACYERDELERRHHR